MITNYEPDRREQIRADHNLYQRRYYEETERARLRPVDSPYVHAHVDRMIAVAALVPGQAVLEIGAGRGKFTLDLVGRGYEVMANDLSPRLLEQLTSASGGRVKTVCCDVRHIAAHTSRRFDRIIGFFVLHHLIDFQGVFTALSAVAKPGARIAFCEPVATNPLYYAQVLFTPGMTFKGERSLTDMRPNIILPTMRAAGFINVASVRYGYFPPQIKNRAWGERLEAWLEKRQIVPFPHAFQLFTAHKPL